VRAHDARMLAEGARVVFRRDGRAQWGTVSGPVRWYRRDSHVVHVPIRADGLDRFVHNADVIRAE
jgi:hypothetical protein